MMAEYIDKKAALADLNETYDNMSGFHPQFYIGYQFAVNLIRNFPEADVAEVRHGRWIEQDEESDWLCANCGSAVCICVCGKDRTKKMSFCPVCGARMDGGADNR